MINVVSNLIGALVLVFAYICASSNLLEKRIILNDYKLYITISLTSILMLFNFFYINPFVRILIISIIFMLCSKLVFNESFNRIIVNAIFIEVLINAFDLLFGFLLIYIIRFDPNNINVFFGTICANIFVSLMLVLFSKIKLVKSFFFKIVTFTEKVNNRKLVFLSFVIIISFNVLLAFFYYKSSVFWQFIINIILLLLYLYIIIKYLETYSKNSIINDENILLMENLNEYENMLDRQRVDNHENKNQLLIIKNMIKKNDKDVIKYIDTIVTDQKEDDELLYTKVKKIPSGGLQGIIYQKMLVMKDKNIKFSIDVSRDVRKINLDNFSMNDNYKLCKIIGVFLDNAIEESVKVDDRKIIISLYEEDEKLIIEVSNKFDGVIDLDSIDTEGFTTKGDGHGYGLSLVKKIVSESGTFVNEREINNDVFKQVIKVKVK